MKGLLSISFAYNFLQSLIAKADTRSTISKEYIKSDSSKRILDLCCGTCEILPHLEFLEYTGVDFSDEYINHAKKKYVGLKKTSFVAVDVNEFLKANKARYDIILMLGAMHHLNDTELTTCLQNIKSALVEGGYLVTIDGCYEPGISGFVKLLLDYDRGKYVRTKDAYLKIFSAVFDDYKCVTRKDLARFPYNHIIFY